jgi:hypothetical protein
VQGEYAKLKTSFDKASTDVSSYKKQLAEKQTDEERAKADAEAREARYKAIERENSINRYKDKLSTSVKDDATRIEIATLMADGKYDEAIDKQNTYLASEATAMEQRIKAELMQQNPQASPQNGGNGAVTKEQFASMGVAERTKLFNEQPELYKQLNSQ